MISESKLDPRFAHYVRFSLWESIKGDLILHSPGHIVYTNRDDKLVGKFIGHIEPCAMTTLHREGDNDQMQTILITEGYISF